MAGLADIVTSLPKLAQSITEVATSDPLSALLVTVGGLLIAGTVAFTGYLALGAVVSGVVPDLN